MSRLFASLTMLALLLFAAAPASAVMSVQPKNRAMGFFSSSTTTAPGESWLCNQDRIRDAERCGYELAEDVRDGPNLYAYVRANPWSKFDPHGLAEDDAGTAIRKNREMLADMIDEGSTGAAHDSLNNGKAMARATADAMDTAVSLTPIGAANEAISGKNAKGEKLGWGERLLSAIGIIPVGKVGKLGKVAEKAASHADEATDLVKTAKKTADASQEAVEAASKDLRRPYIRKDTRKAVEDAAPRTADGAAIDPNTLKPIEGKPDFGHKAGNEHWREAEKAKAEGLDQKQFNDRMNDPSKYQLEDPSSNRSRKHEKKD